jgi:hypothetical protein
VAGMVILRCQKLVKRGCHFHKRLGRRTARPVPIPRSCSISYPLLPLVSSSRAASTSNPHV